MASNRNIVASASALPGWTHATLVGLAAFALFLALWPRFSGRLNPLTGDEPFYVMTAISLLEDQDLDESNNYQPVTVQGDSGPFVLYAFDPRLNPSDPLPVDWNGWASPPRLVGAHAATTDKPGLFTKHGIGLSILIAIPWQIAGRFGANLVVMIAASILAGQMFLLGRDSGATVPVSAVVALGLVATIPIGPYALLLFPEIPAALLLLYSIRRAASRNNSWWQWLAAGSAVGFLPWLHQRFAPTAVVLSIVVLINVLRSHDLPRNAALSLVPVGVGGFSLLAYNQWLYGTPLQRTEDHAGFNRLIGTVNGGFGLLLDAQWGLLITAPVFILALAAFPRWQHVNGRLATTVVVSIAPYLIVVAAYKVWWGEWGPPARYLVPIVPLAAGPLAGWLSHSTVGWRIATYLLWAAGAILTVVGYQDPQRFYHHPDGVNNLIVTVGDQFGVEMQRFLVAFQPFTIASIPARFWMSVAMLVILFLAGRAISPGVWRWPDRGHVQSLQKNLRIG